jgi:hypothetical protein
MDDQALTLDVVCFSSCAECISSVSENSNQSLLVFPIPAEGQLNIIGLKEASQIEIINIQGQTLNAEISKRGEYYSANISMLSPGIYLLKCRDTRQTLRFVKQ